MVKAYPISVTETMLKLIEKDKNSKTRNSHLLYAITQAELRFPNTFVEKITHQFVPDSTEDPVGINCGEHRWQIHMKSIKDLSEKIE